MWGVLPTNIASLNTSRLQTLVTALLSNDGPTMGNGGTIQFPSVGTYKFSGTITISLDDASPPDKQPYSIIFMGTGQGQQDVPILEQTGDFDLFVVDLNDGHDRDIGGVVFQDLLMSYAGTGTAGNSAVHVKHRSQSVRLDRVTLVDWPTGVFLAESYRASMNNCTIHIVGASPPPVTSAIGLQIGDAGSPAAGIETYVAGCLFLDDSHVGTAVQIYGCEHLRMVNTRIDGWQQGILITPKAATDSGSAKQLYFANVSCFPHSPVSTSLGAALLITTNGTTASPRYVVQATFVNCELSAPAGGTAYTGGGVVIGPASGANDAIDQIRFVDCHVCQWNGHGMNIMAGTNIEVLGGYYSCNGVGSANRAGIAITGAASGVRINGAACNNSLYDFSIPGFASATQSYGVEIDASATSIRVIGCDLTGNTINGAAVLGSVTADPTNVFFKHCDFTGLSNPVGVTLPVTNLQISDCPGYNDQGTVLSSTSPAPTGTFHNYHSWPNASAGWFGPIAFYVTGTGHVTIDGIDTTLTNAGFTLSPGESASIAATVTKFVAVGK